MGHSKSKPKKEIKLNYQWIRQITNTSPSPRFDHCMIKYQNKLYLMGGTSEGWEMKNDMWEYNIKDNIWNLVETKGESPPCVKDHSAILFHNEIFFYGGKNGKQVFNEIWIYNIDNHEWKKPPPNQLIPPGRFGHGAILYNEKMYIFAGSADESTPLGDMWEYKIQSNEWKEVTPKTEVAPSARNYLTASLYRNQMIIFAGFTDKPLSDLWTFNLDSSEWRLVGNAPFAPRSGHWAVVDGDCLIIFSGEGRNGQDIISFNDTWQFFIKDEKWGQIAVNSKDIPPSRLGSRIELLSIDSGILIAFGGVKVSGAEWNPGEWYNDTWILTTH